MTRPETLLDRRSYLEGGLVEVGCQRCGVTVRAKKLSPMQTSVQWTRPAVRACAEFAERVAAGQPTALVPTCASLRDSIDQAAREGRLETS